MVAGVGVFLGTVGLDNMTGIARFSFDIPELLDGLGIVPTLKLNTFPMRRVKNGRNIYFS
jgi:TctA family transporter